MQRPMSRPAPLPRRSLLAAGALGVFGAWGARPAQAQGFAPPGFEQVTGREKRPHADHWLAQRPLPAAERARFVARLHALRNLLLAAPALQALRGHDWATTATAKDAADERRPLVGSVLYIAYPYGSPKGGAPVSSYEGAPYQLHVNAPEVVLENQTWSLDAEAGFAAEPQQADDDDGLEVYRDGWLVVRPEGRPLFAPVPQERYLARRIELARRSLDKSRASVGVGTPQDTAAQRRDIEGRMAAWKAARAEAEQRWAAMQSKWPDRVAHERARFDAKEAAAMKEAQDLQGSTPAQRFLASAQAAVEALEAERAALAPARRAAPACLPSRGASGRPSGLAAAGDEGARVVVLNPALFDPKRPRSDVQLLVVGPTRYFPALYDTVQHQLDKRALRAFLA